MAAPIVNSPQLDWSLVLAKIRHICRSKGETRNVAPNQCACLIQRVDELHKSLVNMLDFKRDLLRDCKPALGQLDRVMERSKSLLDRCASDAWLWHTVLKREHKLNFQMLMELEASAWEWPASEILELDGAAALDVEHLKKAAAKLSASGSDAAAAELGKYLLDAEENESKSKSKRSRELPEYLFRNPTKVMQGKLIGEGAYGTVYEAKWLERTVATKAYAVQDPTSERELLTLFSLRHPNIVKMIGYTQRTVGGPYVLVMERMERDLHNLIRDRVKAKPGPPFDMDVAVDIILQIARGMEFLHANEVSHLDLKTANILVNLPSKGCDFYTAKLSDFGLAETKLKSAQTKIPVRRAGTVNFMAPEVWYEDNNACRRKADVYSFGMTCYEVLMGRVPFEGYSFPAAGFFLRVKDHNLRPTLPPDFPRCLALFLQCCWHGKPEIRPSFEMICNYLVAVKNVLPIEECGNELPGKNYLEQC